MNKTYAIVWKIDLPAYNIKAGDVVRLDLHEPVGSSTALFEVVEIEYGVVDNSPSPRKDSGV